MVVAEPVKITAIETRYKGYRFRSRLEARWAVLFDSLGVEWEYEKEGYDLGEAGWYLPDFWLPQFQAHVEIKPTLEEVKGSFGKWRGMSALGDFLVLHDISVEGVLNASSSCGLVISRNGMGHETLRGFRWAYTDHALGFLVHRDDGVFLWRGHDAFFQLGQTVANALYDALTLHPCIVRAFEAARSARFEHGS
jgi:hypothetical protein